LIGKTLAHYRITASLGKGGMGEVYLAEDTRLKRQVALKLLPPEVMGDAASRDRFQREAEAVAALDHPNIVAIHSIEAAPLDGGSGELQFFTMQLVRGKTLDQLIPPTGLGLEAFLDLAIPLTDAVGAAHHCGITHRDLKPSNIMVGEDDRLRVLDFGLAKLAEQEPQEVSEAAPTLESPLTRTGTVLGTVPYMSPEQAKGLPVDPRSDVFSLGSILYEMAAGSRPFAGDSAADLMSAILRDTPAPLCDRRTELPVDIDRILARCLAKNRDDRYLTAKDLCQDLEGVRKEMNNSARSGRSTPSGASNLPLPERPSLAVLPFVNLSGDPEQDYFAAGLWTDINADLVKISGLFLISQTSTGLYKDRSTTPRQVGSELGVRYVLEGTVRKAGNQVRVTARLVDAQTGEPLWAERYDSKLDDLFELQDEINQNIVEALDVKLIHGESHRVLQRSMKDPKARDTYYRALAAFFTLRREDLAAARLLLDEVAGMEPEDPHAHIFSAFSHYFEAILDYSDNREASLELALESADRAIALDDPTGFAQMIRGMVLLLRKDHDGSMRAADRAVLDRPNCPWAYALKGAIYNYAGRPGEAIELAKQAIRHTPLTPPVFPAVLATAHYLAGQHAEAADAARSTIDIAPDTLEAHVVLAAALVASGDVGAAAPVLSQIRRLKSDFSLSKFAESQPYKDPSVLTGLLDDLSAAGLS